MGRGLERRRVFSSVVDKQDFLTRLGKMLGETDCQCMAWAIMSNHYHLFIQVGSIPLSQLMRRLLSGYATNYNLRHKRSGYVFQNRYKSILCDADEYFLSLVRYIHLNPLQAKMISTMRQLDDYAWTGHASVIGKRETSWQNTEAVLLQFGKHKAVAKCRYRDYIQQGTTNKSTDLSGGGLIRSYGGWQEVTKHRKNHEARIGDERILGDSAFVEQSIKEDDIKMKQEIRLKKQGWDLKKMVRYVCKRFKLKEDQIRVSGRNNTVSHARDVLCFWAKEHLGLTSTQLEAQLKLSQSAVSRAAKRGRDYCFDHKMIFSGA